MGNVTWGAEMMKDDVCSSFIEERLQLILSNHMYIEHGLQTAYTAATFFLFQNGVVKDVVELNDASDRLSLNFQLNTQRVALLASIPDQNARLTLVGCGLLLVSLGIVAAWAWATSPKSGARTSGGLGLVTTPHVVARVMLDSEHFPPMFLHRRVVIAPGHGGNKDDKSLPTTEDFLIDRLTLQPPASDATSDTASSA